MEKIFETASDLHVRVIKAYVQDEDTYAYVDSTFSTKFSADDLHNAYLMGQLLIVDEAGNEYKPVACAIASGVATVIYVTADATTATTAVLATVQSE